MQRILITGAEGFVGRWAADALTHAYPGVCIVLSARNAWTASWPIPDGAIIDRLDITDPASINDLLVRHRPDAVLHLAGISAVRDAEADVRRAYDVNLYGTVNLADAMVRTVPDARLVHVGSADVYGAILQSSPIPISEDATIAPLNTYALSKAAGDLAIGAKAAGGLRTLRLRPFNHAGPGQDSRFVISAFARQIAQIEAGLREPVLEVGDLSAKREFLDVRDVARAYALAFAADDKWWNGTIVNIAGGHGIRIGDMLDKLLSLSTSTVTIRQSASLTRPAESGFAGGDTSRAMAVLDWKPAIPFDTTLTDTLNFWRSHPKQD